MSPGRATERPESARQRHWRTRSGRSRTTLIDLADLGVYLGTLTPEQARTFAEIIGEDVAVRATTAAQIRRIG